jgi:hypothetical protein
MDAVSDNLPGVIALVVGLFTAIFAYLGKRGENSNQLQAGAADRSDRIIDQIQEENDRLHARNGDLRSALNNAHDEIFSLQVELHTAKITEEDLRRQIADNERELTRLHRRYDPPTIQGQAS